MGTGRLVLTACILVIISTPAAAQVMIGFDTDPNGNPVVAPTLFANTVPLTTLYTPMGVTFSGPGPLDGGAILSGGGFGVQPRSAPNFLAFNNTATIPMQNGGFPRDPATLNFSPEILAVSIWASGGTQSTSFRMDAFDAASMLVATTTATNAGGQYAQLSLASATPITRVVLTEIGGDNAFVYDDLSFTFIPEPATATALGLLAFGLMRRR